MVVLPGNQIFEKRDKIPVLACRKRPSIPGNNAAARGGSKRIAGFAWRLEFTQRRPFSNLIPAEVIGRDPDQLYDTIVVNAGTRAGIQTEQPVVTAAGLVGHVIHADENASTVQLIMRSRVSAVVQQGRAHGVVSWVPGGRFQLRYVDARSIIEPGDRVVTSGLGVVIPRALPSGMSPKSRSSGRTLYSKPYSCSRKWTSGTWKRFSSWVKLFGNSSTVLFIGKPGSKKRRGLGKRIAVSVWT